MVVNQTVIFFFQMHFKRFILHIKYVMYDNSNKNSVKVIIICFASRVFYMHAKYINEYLQFIELFYVRYRGKWSSSLFMSFLSLMYAGFVMDDKLILNLYLYSSSNARLITLLFCFYNIEILETNKYLRSFVLNSNFP